MREEYKYCPVCGTPLESGVFEAKKRKFCPNCDFIDYKNPLPVALAIAVKNKRFLLIKRGVAPGKGRWASPSGFIELGETPEEACLRELEEETGASGRIAKLVGVVRQEDREVYGDMLVVEYLVEVGDEELAPGDEVEDAKFFDMTDLPDYYLAFFNRIVEEVQKGA